MYLKLDPKRRRTFFVIDEFKQVERHRGRLRDDLCDNGNPVGQR